MPFSSSVKRNALIKSRRHCCICHKFSGLYTDIHHITQEADGGKNTIDNAIALCRDCHGQAGHYNNRHSIGNKYHPLELKTHRDKWWQWCDINPFKPLPDDPILVSPETIPLPYIAHIPGATSIPVEIEVKNKTDKNLYSIWVLINLASANTSGMVIDFENIYKMAQLKKAHIKPITNTVSLKYQSMGNGLPNYDLTKSSIFVKGKGKNAVGYLGISRLGPNEKRTFNLKVKNVIVSQTKEIPLRLDSFSETATSWLVEKNNSFILNFDLPDKKTLKQDTLELGLINVKYKKRD